MRVCQWIIVILIAIMLIIKPSLAESAGKHRLTADSSWLITLPDGIKSKQLEDSLVVFVDEHRSVDLFPFILISRDPIGYLKYRRQHQNPKDFSEIQSLNIGGVHLFYQVINAKGEPKSVEMIALSANIDEVLLIRGLGFSQRDLNELIELVRKLEFP